MGQIADDMIDGVCCSICGCYFTPKDTTDEMIESVGYDVYEHGYPVVCNSCWKDMTAKERKNHMKQHDHVKTI